MTSQITIKKIYKLSFSGNANGVVVEEWIFC